MTSVPRFLVNLLAGVRLARFSRRLQSPTHAAEAQARILSRLLGQVARTEFGRQHGLSATTSYEEFRAKVPPRTYAGFQPLIARMVAGEPDVLVPGPCPLYVQTAGTTGPAKLLPVPEAMLAHYRVGLRDVLFHHARRAGHAGVFFGRHLQVGASTTVTAAAGVYRTSLDGILALCLSAWSTSNLLSPPPSVAQLPEGAAKLEATARTMLDQDVSLVGGTPASLCALAAAVAEHTADASAPSPTLSAVWPNLECCLHTGASLGFHAEPLRSALGSSVSLHEVYAAAEGILAAQDSSSPGLLRLLADAGVFFEFLPVGYYRESTVANVGSHCVPLAQVQTGTEYVVVLTTPAGLCRYVTGDNVRFASTQPPRLQFTGRADLQLTDEGERIREADLVTALQAVCLRNGWSPIAFHVAPYKQRLGPGQVAHVHEWWLELGTHSVRTPMANTLGPELDRELSRISADYALRRVKNLLGAPQIRLVVPGVFAQWAGEQHQSLGKLPRCRPDRLIADQLAALAPFHQMVIVPGHPTCSSPPQL